MGVLFAAFGNMMVAPFAVLGPAIAKRSLGGPASWALILAASNVGAFAGGLAVLRPAPAAVLAAGALLSGAGLMVSNSLCVTTLQQQVPAAALSRVSAYDWFGSLAMQPVGFALVGPVSVLLGVRRLEARG